MIKELKAVNQGSKEMSIALLLLSPGEGVRKTKKDEAEEEDEDGEGGGGVAKKRKARGAAKAGSRKTKKNEAEEEDEEEEDGEGPFLNSLAVDVKKYCLDAAVTVTNTAGTDLNLLTQHGSFTEADATAFFTDACKEQITGIPQVAGTVVALAGTSDAAHAFSRLRKSRPTKSSSTYLRSR